MSTYHSDRYQERKKMTFDVPDTKTCSKCRATKPGIEFKKEINNSDGLKGECNECFRNRVLVRKFGITKYEYDTIELEQNSVCAICKETCKTGRALAVDHCHDTGKVRGLLCAKCNRGLGMFNDDAALLMEAYNYLWERKN